MKNCANRIIYSTNQGFETMEHPLFFVDVNLYFLLDILFSLNRFDDGYAHQLSRFDWSVHQPDFDLSRLKDLN